LYKQLYLKEPFGDNPMPDSGLVISTLVIALLLLMFVFLRLKTTVDSEGIKMSLYPFRSKKVLWTEVEHACVLKYGFVGGWGVGFSSKYGTVYNIKGNRGLFIEQKNGKKFLIGTQKEKELAKVIEFYFNKNKPNRFLSTDKSSYLI
jgi:hypothetical protein